jgi:hypothetical protein
MIVGVPKEIKDQERRVGLVPSGVTALREAGHRMRVPESRFPTRTIRARAPRFYPPPKFGPQPIWSSRLRSRSRPSISIFAPT